MTGPAGASAKAPWRVDSRSMRFSLFALIMAVVLPATAAFSLLIYDLYRQDRAARERQLFSTSQVLASAVDADLGRGWALLDALARSAALKRHDWQMFDGEARSMAPPGTAFVLASPAEGRLVNTRLPFGVHLADNMPHGFSQRWLALQLVGRQVSDVFTGPAAAHPTVALDLLVKEGGRPAYILSMFLQPSVEERLLVQQKLARGWVSGLLDSRGVLIARSPPLPIFVGQPGTPDMVRHVLAGEEGVALTVSRLGVPMVAAYARSRQSGWTTVVAAPRAEFESVVRRSLLIALALSAFVLAAGAGLALGLSRRLLKAMGALTAQAQAVGEGRPAPAAATGLAETDRVAEALATASAERDRHERDLGALNASLETRVAEATERMVQAQKMEAVGQLTGGIAHDFNNLLTAILGSLGLLRRSVLDERQARYAANAQAAAERGAKLTQQLLAFSRRQRLTPEPVDLNALITQARDLIASSLGGGVRLNLVLRPGCPTALADRTQLELAILNLALNARDAMPNGGDLTITVTETEVDTAAAAREGAPPAGRYVSLAIRDTGQGMSEDVRRRAFEPFFTTKGPGRGSGLGLSQALGMARQLGGGMLIDSRPGEGASVTLLLPPTDRSAPAPRAVRPAEAAAPLDGIRVLLVDDDPSVREATADTLSDLGCQVTAMASAEEALAALPDAIDVAVVDFAMPGLNGMEFARRLAALRPDTPVLLITGYADPETLGQAWRGPLLAKPFDHQSLAAAVAALVARAPA